MMTEKFIDLGPQIAKEAGGLSLTSLAHEHQLRVLKWLDENVDQVPGRTITASRKREIAQRLEFDPRYSFDEMVHDFGLVSVPDPEPTNAELLEAEIKAMFQEPSQSFSIARDLAEKLDTAGWTKAPGDES